jgi:hypothetical protein
MLLTEKRSQELMAMNTDLSQKTSSLETKYHDTIEELTQTLARQDLYKMQSEELSNECGALRVSASKLCHVMSCRVLCLVLLSLTVVRVM